MWVSHRSLCRLILSGYTFLHSLDSTQTGEKTFTRMSFLYIFLLISIRISLSSRTHQWRRGFIQCYNSLFSSLSSLLTLSPCLFTTTHSLILSLPLAFFAQRSSFVLAQKSFIKCHKLLRSAGGRQAAGYICVWVGFYCEYKSPSQKRVCMPCLHRYCCVPVLVHTCCLVIVDVCVCVCVCAYRESDNTFSLRCKQGDLSAASSRLRSSKATLVTPKYTQHGKYCSRAH